MCLTAGRAGLINFEVSPQPEPYYGHTINERTLIICPWILREDRTLEIEPREERNWKTRGDWNRARIETGTARGEKLETREKLKPREERNYKRARIETLADSYRSVSSGASDKGHLFKGHFLMHQPISGNIPLKEDL